MPTRYSSKKTQRFYFMQDGEETSLVLIYGDKVETMTGAAFKGAGYIKVKYRGRIGALKRYANGPALMDTRALETYFLDVGQGDAAFIVTPNNTKILVDGGITNSTAEFLIWKYRLDRDGNELTIDHLFLGSGPINPAPSARDQFLLQSRVKYEDVAGSHASILRGFAPKTGRALRVHPESPSCGFIQT
ncbi:MAG: hypothetical protein L3J33_10840 [Rhodobacteraceae bacterium]|nr:hypothetical protein [Paracoccaceae bacterium]